MVGREVQPSSAWSIPDEQLYLLYQPEVLLHTGPQQVREISSYRERGQASSHCPDSFNRVLNSEILPAILSGTCIAGLGKASLLFGPRYPQLQKK